jgi:hypothetical protein
LFCRLPRARAPAAQQRTSYRNVPASPRCFRFTRQLLP